MYNEIVSQSSFGKLITKIIWLQLYTADFLEVRFDSDKAIFEQLYLSVQLFNRM